jgi:ABC-type sugar transport system permease subunit
LALYEPTGIKSKTSYISMNKKSRNKEFGYLLLLPYFILYFLFFFIPAIAILPMSLLKWNIIGEPKFILFKNYFELFKDEMFWKATGNTFYYTIVVTIVLTLLGLLLAILLNQKIKGRIIGRTFIVLPFVICSSAAGILWRWIYDRNFGILNSYLKQLGITLIGWLSDVRFAMPSIIIMNSWWSVAFNTIIYLAALQGIPSELTEAAEVDGATKFQSLRYITLPLLRPITLYVVILCAANSFQIFDEAYIMTQGGPIGSTTTLVYKIYSSAFENLRFGYSAAISVVTLVIILLFTITQFWLGRRRSIEGET